MRGFSVGRLVAFGLTIALICAVFTSSVLGAPSAAQTSGMTLVSGIQIQNLSASATAHVTIKFYNPGGAQVEPLAGVYVELGPGAQRTFYLPGHVPQLPSPFLGSAVVESDTPVMATVNTQYPSGTSPMRLGTSLGVANPSNSVYLPQLMKRSYGTWSSHFSVQNAGSGTANVTVKYFDRGTGNEVTAARETASIPVNGSRLFTQTDNAGLPEQFMGGATVESSGPIAVMADFWNIGDDTSTMQFHSYNGFASGSTKLYLPRVVRKYYDYNSGVTVQNVTPGADAHVTVTFNFGGQSFLYNMTLKPGQGAGPYIRDLNNLPAGSGSAVVTSDVPVVAIVNEDNRTLGRGVTYNGVLEGTQTAKLFFPAFTSQYYGYASGIQIQNVGTSTANGTAVFKQPGRSDVSVPFSIPPLQSWSKFGPDLGLGWDFNGAVSVTSSSPVVGIVNQSFRGDRDPRYGNITGDTFLTYNGVNLP